MFLRLAGSFTSGGVANDAIGLMCQVDITGASGDTDIFAQIANSGTIATQAVSESINVIAGIRCREPVITDNLTGGGTITIAAALYVQDAPTEGVTNAAIYVAAGATDLRGPLRLPTVTTLANDATPSVSASNLFKTGGTTTITDLDDGVVGQTIRILSAHAITITDGTNILLNGSANFVMAAGDVLVLTMYNDQVWEEDARKVN